MANMGELTQSARRPRGTALVFQASVILCVLAGGALLVANQPPLPESRRFFLLLTCFGWTALVAGAELLPVPAWRGLQMSLGLPILIAASIMFPPAAAGLIAFVGSVDPREFRKQITFTTALFNRSQVALSVVTAGAVFRSLAHLPPGNWLWDPAPVTASWALALFAMLAASVDYIVNSGLVTAYLSLDLGLPPLQVMRQLRIGDLRDYLVSYLGLGVLGLSLVVLFKRESYLALPAFFAPLLFARQMFLRTLGLQEAHKELQEREQVLRHLSNAMAEERADERLQIAGYLHDDLAQVLFRLSIQVDVARKLLDKGELAQVTTQLEKIRESKQETSDRIRALIRDLHRSPLGAKGLAEALESFTDEVGRDSNVQFHRDVADIDLPAPIALLVYHIAREGLMNALKHAHASDMWISVREVDDQIELQLRDNGVGFDMSLPGPEGHFGMAMMKERAEVGGGKFQLEAAPGQGATITVRFPTALLQTEPQSSASQPPTSGAGPTDASPDTSGPDEQAGDSSRQAVRA
jgi:signal transduction histidine kinase